MFAILARPARAAALALPLALALALPGTDPAGAAEIVDTGENSVQLNRDQGVLVRLERPVNSVFVADPEIADVQVKSPRLVYVFGKKPGETTMFAVDSNDQVVMSERLVVQHNLAALERALADLAPAQPIEVRAIGDAILISGRLPSPSAAENARRLAARFAGEQNVINRIQVTGPTQINLRVRVAEVSRELSKSLGVQWDALLQNGSDLLGFAGGGLTGLAGSYTGFGQLSNGTDSVSGILDVLATEGLVSILAEPNLTAMSGETATFLAGGEFPIPVAEDDDQITIEFKQFGVQLEFTPTLLQNGQISLAVAPEVSELNRAEGFSFGRVTVPAISTRRASTTVELASGQSFAIAGLLQNTQNHEVDKLPGFGDVPILGALFKSDKFQRGETELAIIVTPYIVKPVSTRQLAAPTDELLPPDDIERIFFGRMYGDNSRERMAAKQELDGKSLAGPVGFMLEE
jgi:pilus assembly protein CpaC